MSRGPIGGSRRGLIGWTERMSSDMLQFWGHDLSIVLYFIFLAFFDLGMAHDLYIVLYGQCGLLRWTFFILSLIWDTLGYIHDYDSLSGICDGFCDFMDTFSMDAWTDM